MLTTCTVPVALAADELVLDALSAAGLPQAASRPPAPLAAASAPADLAMNARRVEHAPISPACMTMLLSS
jgi:hypothetical protein